MSLRALQRNTARFALRVTRGLFGAAPLLVPLLEDGVADVANMPPRLIARYLAPYVGRDGVNHLLVLARAIRAEELQEVDLGEIRAPAQVIWGDAEPWLDGTIPERLTAALRDCSVTRLPGVGRLIPEEDPDRLADLMIATRAEHDEATR